MNSKQIWNLLEKLETQNIQILIDMSVRYLEYNRGLDFKTIIKDIKNTKKALDRSWYYEK